VFSVVLKETHHTDHTNCTYRILEETKLTNEAETIHPNFTESKSVDV